MVTSDTRKSADQILKETLVNFALDYKKTEMLMNLSSQEWKRHIIRERELPLRTKLVNPTVPEFDFNQYCFIKGRSWESTNLHELFEIEKDVILSQDISSSYVEVKDTIKEYISRYNPKFRVMKFLDEIRTKPDYLNKTKIVNSSQYRTLTFFVNPQSITVVTFKEDLIALTEMEALEYIAENAESICLCLSKPFGI